MAWPTWPNCLSHRTVTKVNRDIFIIKEQCCANFIPYKRVRRLIDDKSFLLLTSCLGSEISTSYILLSNYLQSNSMIEIIAKLFLPGESMEGPWDKVHTLSSSTVLCTICFHENDQYNKAPFLP